MRSRTEYSVGSRQVHDRAAAVIQNHVGLTDHGHKCTASIVITILLYAASRITSVFDACGRLAGAPSDQALRDALRATLPPIDELERRLNGGLAADLPKTSQKRCYPLVIDLTLIPYHGEPYRDPEEIYRGESKSGTSHFHAYATAYVVRHGRRFTVAMTRVLRGEPEPSKSLWRFFVWRRSGWSKHSWRDKHGRRATVGICVVHGRFGKRRKPTRPRTFVYVFGLPRRSRTSHAPMTYTKTPTPG